MILRLLLAGLLGGLIGFERSAHGRPAGLRTHILVSLGSAMFTVVSASFAAQHADPTRIASQIVSGIGFLGAGTIIRQGSIVRGLTTAASLWTTSAIGMAVGAGSVDLIYLAVAASIIVFVTLSVISRFEHAMITSRDARDLVVTLTDRSGIPNLLAIMDKFGATVRGLQSEGMGPGNVETRLRMTVPIGSSIDSVNAELTGRPEIKAFDWE